MPLFITNKVHGHDHVARITPVQGETTYDADHYHTIALFPDAPPSMTDPSPLDGHIHELREYEPKPPAEFPTDQIGDDAGDGMTMQERAEQFTKDENACVNRVGEMFHHASRLESPSIKRGMQDEKMYRGCEPRDQWPHLEPEGDDSDLITVNETESKIDLLCGYLAQNKTDFKFFPVESGDGRGAQVLDVIAKVDVADACDYHSEEAEVFLDACIAGRGLFNVYVDFSRNSRGSLVIEQYPWNAVRFGPHRHADLRDCEYLVKFKWLSLARIKALYPDVDLSEVSDTMNRLAGNPAYAKVIDYEIIDPYDIPGGNVEEPVSGPDQPPVFSSRDISPERKEVVVYECWEKHYVINHEFVDTDTAETVPLTGWDERDVDRLRSLPGVEIADIEGVRMYVTVIAGGKILKEGYPDYPYQGFHIVPVYCKKRGNVFWSKVRAGFDLQQIINKRFSQIIEEVSRNASGWFYDDQTFMGTQENDFRNGAAYSNFMLMVKDTNHPPVRINGNANIAQLEQVLEIASMKIREIMGINPEMMGINSKAESGIAIFQKQRQGLMGNVFLFEHLSDAKKTLGRIILSYIQALYTPKRVLRILQNSQLRKKLQNASPVTVSPTGNVQGLGDSPAGTDIFNLTEEEITRILATLDANKYDYATGEQRESPTMRMAWFEIFKSFFDTHPVAGAEKVMFAMSDVPDRELLIQILDQAAQAAQQADIARAQARVTAPARGQAPPTVTPGQQPNSPASALPPATAEPGPIAGSTAAAALPPEAGILTPPGPPVP